MVLATARLSIRPKGKLTSVNVNGMSTITYQVAVDRDADDCVFAPRWWRQRVSESRTVCAAIDPVIAFGMEESLNLSHPSRSSSMTIHGRH